MGEAKRKNSLQVHIRLGALPCIYCGGHLPGNQVDHMPPRIMFRFKRRPNELFFPSCAACNQGSGDLDQIASFLARMFPPIDDPQERAERSKLVNSFRANYPEVASGMYPEGTVTPQSVAIGSPIVMKMDDPYWHHIMELFASKVGMALHYHLTKAPVPPDGEIYSTWFSNIQRIADEIPHELLDLFPTPKSLSQGEWSVADQFQYDSVTTVDKSQTTHMAAFRSSFAVVSFISTKPLPQLHSRKRPHKPGCLQGGYPYGLTRMNDEELRTRFARMNDPAKR